MTVPREQAADVTVDTATFTNVVSPSRRLQDLLAVIDVEITALYAAASEPPDPFAMSGNVVKLVYMTVAVSAVGQDGWYFPNKGVPTLTGRTASIVWEGTAAQIPAQGTTDTSFKVGDTAMVRTESL